MDDQNNSVSFAGGGDLHLLEEFPAHSYDDWRKAAEALLKGAPFDKIMRTKTFEGFDLEPIFRREDIEGLAHLGQLPGLSDRVRGNRLSGNVVEPWLISQELVASTPAEFNSIALHELSRGQNELNVQLDLATRSGQDPDVAEAGRVGACGLSLATLGDMERAFRDIDLRAISTYFRAGSSGLPVAAAFFAYARKAGVPLDELRGCIEMDPLASLARLGKISVSLDTAFDEMAQLTAFAADKAPNMQTIGVQGDAYHNGGGSAVQELAFVLATGVQYLREMQERGLDVDTVAPRMRFAYSVGTDFFLEIAKLRAARLLWARIVDAFGGNEASRSTHIHARTGLWGMTKKDPYVNMLRASTEAFSAAIGGCNSLHVGAFDEIFSVPSAFSRRIARNVQVILQEECNLTDTIDPAGGSYYVEWLTDQVARHAWDLFQKVESAGGMRKALAEGIPQAEIGGVFEGRRKLIHQRRAKIVGTNMYPNATEKPAEVHIPDYGQLRDRRARELEDYRTGASNEVNTEIMNRLNALLEATDEQVVERAIFAVFAGASIGEMSRVLRKDQAEPASLEAIPFRRAAMDYEALRAAAASYAGEKGHAPRILQANMGPSRRYRARADWTAAFFEAGGFEVLGADDFDSPEAVVAKARETGAPVVVITSTDEDYQTVVEPLAKALKALDSAPHVMVAGAPGENEAAWKSAGVDEFVHVKVNNYDVNHRLLMQVGALA